MSGGSQRTLGPLRWSRPARLLAGLVVAALVVTLLPPDAQGGETPRAQADEPPQEPASEAVTAQAGGFSDVPSGHVFEDDITWLASTGITQGRGDGTFGLNDPVTRGAMAAFLYRFSERPRVPVDAERFTDVPAGHTFESDIAWLASTGITRGRGDGTFGLGDAVTRGAMAAFLYRAAGSPEVAGGGSAFVDVPAGHVFASEIAWLASTGITRGRPDGTFGLNQAVTRGQMAAFLSRFDDWLLPQAGAVFATPGNGSAQLGWIAVPVPGIVYQVERAPGRWGPWEPVTTTDAGADGVRLQDLDNGAAVFLRLRSADDTGRRSLPTEPVGATPVELPAIDPELTTDTLRVTRSQVLAANPAADGGSLVTLDDRVAVEGPGQLLVIEPSPPMPRGMLAEVSEIVDDHPGPGQQLLLTDAALEEVFVDPQIDWEVDLTPQPVDDVGSALLSTAPRHTTDGTVTTVGLPTSALSCKDTGGIPLSPDAVWETGNPFPIELTLRNVRTTHVFDPGSRLFNRDPLLLMQVAGEVDTTLAMTAKLGVTCELSSQWRQNHPIFSAYLGTIGGIPVTVNLEPAFSLTIAASGRIGFTETRYFSYTVEKDGDQPIDFRRAGSADPPELTATAGFSAEVFAGGDLSVMFGGGTGPANAAAGLFLEFGPALTASSTLTDPDCITLDLDFRASGGIRLELWVKRWNLELANANYTLTQLAEYCASEDSVPTPSAENWRRIAHDEAVFGGNGVQAMRSVTAGGPGIVAVGDDSGRNAAAVWTSPDGIIWERIPHDEAVFGGPGEQFMYGVTTGGPGLVAVGRDLGLDAGAVWTTGDGYVWQRAERESTVFEDGWPAAVTAGGPGLVAAGQDTARDSAAVWTSVDGRSWQRISHDETVFGGAGSQAIADLTVGGPGLVAVGTDNGTPAVWTSADGRSWQRANDGQASLDAGTMSAVTASGPGLVAVGSDARFGVTAAVWVSSDGQTWQRVPHDESIFGGEGWQIMRAIIDIGAGLVAIGNDSWAQVAVWTSTNGQDWQRVPHDPAAFGGLFGELDEPVMFDLAAGGPGLVAVGAGGGMTNSVAAVWTSP